MRRVARDRNDDCRRGFKHGDLRGVSSIEKKGETVQEALKERSQGGSDRANRILLHHAKQCFLSLPKPLKRRNPRRRGADCAAAPSARVERSKSVSSKQNKKGRKETRRHGATRRIMRQTQDGELFLSERTPDV
ncbi:hypothetical protein MTO96_004174 [Rhipicephalus appendiculatus]